MHGDLLSTLRRDGVFDRTKEMATLGGGCFWCTEAVLEDLSGVERVDAGYAGGIVPNPTYEQVCAGYTGHAEVVQVTFDPEVVSYGQLLAVFFTTHDPTTPNMQDADVGSQYRSIIFYHDEKQKGVAEEVMREVNAAAVWGRPLVTQLVRFEAFYKAEGYHQRYFKSNPEKPYCRVVIAPKVVELRRRYAELLKKAGDVPKAR